MATDRTGDDARDLDQMVTKLTEAIRQLASSPRPDPRDGTDDSERRLHERVGFGYRALGTLMGRVSRTAEAEFDVAVFGARWQARRPVIRLRGLPDGANWIELRSGRRVEVLEVRRRDDPDPDIDRDADDEERPLPRIAPQIFTPDTPIGSMVALRRRRGSPVAFGPRLAPRPSASRPIDVT
ncbi:MAG TPA: hypothetical protein VK875_08485 [Euzebyales bacterium]|nr:hypothetical protein [Euzebyales bacterium]